MSIDLLEKETKEQKDLVNSEFECCSKAIKQQLDSANKNTLEIIRLSKDSNNKKFDYFPFWKNKESRLLLRELKNTRTFYKKYKRGTIIKVDFGVNIGSEFSQIHYAIVINKNDNRKNKILNVIPLTSKDKSNTLNIGDVIFKSFLESTSEKLDSLIDNFKKESLNIDSEDELNKKINDEMEKVKKIIDYYSRNPVCSFACYKNITTINKSRIKNPINEYDFINKAICDNSVMTKLDLKILEHYTNLSD